MAEAKIHPVCKALDKHGPENIHREDLDLSSIGRPGKIAYLLHGVLSQEECQALIRETETVGYEQALVHNGENAVLVKGYRDSKRVMIDDVNFADTLFKRIGHLLPQKFQASYSSHVFKLKEINERLRFLRYDPGDKFQPHCDGSYTRSDGSAQTFITLQLYLNEGMEGGETTFLKCCSFEQEELRPENRVAVTPKTGSILVFEHKILHEGSEVRNGTKYTIRMDVLYEYDNEANAEIDKNDKILSKKWYRFWK